MDFRLGQSLVMDFPLGQSLVVALLQYYFGRRLGNRFYMGRPRGYPLRESFIFWLTVGVAIMGFVSINVVMLIIRFQPSFRHRSLSLSHFQYAQIRMPCFGNKWVWNTILIVHNYILSDEYCGGYVWQGYRSLIAFSFALRDSAPYSNRSPFHDRRIVWW